MKIHPGSHARRTARVAWRRRRGAIVILAAFVLIGLMMILAVAVDLGYHAAIQTQLRRTVDAGALAGAGALVDGADAASNEIRRYIALNPVGGRVLADDDIEIETGHWDAEAKRLVDAERLPSAVRTRVHLHNQTPDLWMTSAQPVTAVKDAVREFFAYLQEVDSDDRAGLVIYNSSSGDALVESALTNDFQSIQDTTRQRQAGHYDTMTNIGAGLKKARLELEQHARTGAFKMIVLMTDGEANEPQNTNYARQYALDQAQLAADDHYPVVTISLGSGADTGLMDQIAQITGGFHFNIPGGQSASQYEDELKDVFRRIADDRALQLVQ